MPYFANDNKGKEPRDSGGRNAGSVASKAHREKGVTKERATVSNFQGRDQVNPATGKGGKKA